jgi:predicted permease
VAPTFLSDSEDILASIAFTMVAFLLGGTLSKAKLSDNGKTILIVSLSIVMLTAMLVFLGLMAIGTSTHLALLLAGIATATAPAATQDAVHQIRAKGPVHQHVAGHCGCR